MNKIILNGKDLKRQQVIDVACNHARVSIDTSKINGSVNYITQQVKEKKIIYGVTTGFGANTDKMIDEKDTVDLQLNLLRSHACGFGNNFSVEIVRAIMVIRLNTLLMGHSGVQQSTVDQLAFLLNNDIHPVIPEQGSVGASGDLCPLSHMALPLIGEGEIEYGTGDKKIIEASEERKGANGKYYRIYKTEDFLKTDVAGKIGFRAVTLGYKEGLALLNGTSVMAAVGAIALHKAERVLKVAMLSSSLIIESLGARKDFFACEKLHQVRNHSGQSEIAVWLTALLSDSKMAGISQKEILDHVIAENLIEDTVILETLKSLNSIEETDRQEQIPSYIIDKIKAEAGELKARAGLLRKENKEAEAGELQNKGNHLSGISGILYFAKKKWKPQDAYSIRCIPQVFGASKTAIDHAVSIIEHELNAAVDNPLIFAEDDKIVSGGNFHGQPIALVMDYLKLAVAEIGNITERQINKLVDSSTNDGLPRFLANDTGLNSGLMIIQYAAASIVSENKVLVHPASADSIPTSENMEDHVSMGTIAARQALQITENAEKIIAYAVFTGFYALTMRLELFKKVRMENQPQKRLAKATYDFYIFLQKTNQEFDIDNKFLGKDRFFKPELELLHANFDAFADIADKYYKK